MEQIFATISTSSTTTQGQDFSSFSSSANFGSGLSADGASVVSYSESSSFGGADAVSADFGASASGVDVATAAFNSVDTNQDGSISRSEFAQFFEKGL